MTCAAIDAIAPVGMVASSSSASGTTYQDVVDAPRSGTRSHRSSADARTWRLDLARRARTAHRRGDRRSRPRSLSRSRRGVLQRGVRLDLRGALAIDGAMRPRREDPFYAAIGVGHACHRTLEACSIRNGRAPRRKPRATVRDASPRGLKQRSPHRCAASGSARRSRHRRSDATAPRRCRSAPRSASVTRDSCTRVTGRSNVPDRVALESRCTRMPSACASRRSHSTSRCCGRCLATDRLRIRDRRVAFLHWRERVHRRASPATSAHAAARGSRAHRQGPHPRLVNEPLRSHATTAPPHSAARSRATARPRCRFHPRG